MRPIADAAKLRAFMREVGKRARQPARVYLVGGSSAVLIGWRSSTADVEALRLFGLIEPELIRYPAIDPAGFRRAVEAAFGRTG